MVDEPAAMQHNWVEFRKYSALPVSGYYQVSDSCVSPNQGTISRGTILEFDSEGAIDFCLGRQSTREVANWFNNIAGQKNTFGHPAGSLNFAVLGTLIIINFSGDELVFNNIVLAQGHAGTSNNWWFGGENCEYVGDDTVRAYTTAKDAYLFTRGGATKTNEVTVLPEGIIS